MRIYLSLSLSLHSLPWLWVCGIDPGESFGRALAKHPVLTLLASESDPSSLSSGSLALEPCFSGVRSFR